MAEQQNPNEETCRVLTCVAATEFVPVLGGGEGTRFNTDIQEVILRGRPTVDKGDGERVIILSRSSLPT